MVYYHTMNETLADRIRARLEELDLSITAAAERVGKKKDLFYNYLRGQSKEPRRSTLTLMAKALETSPDWLLSGTGPKEATDRVLPSDHDHFYEEQITLPRMGKVAAGLWREFSNTQIEPGEDRSVLSPHPAYPLNAQFTVLVDGNSINKRYPHGSELLCVDMASYGMTVEELKNNDLVIIERHREDDGTFEYTAKYVYLNFKLNRVEFHPWSTDPNFQKPLVLPEHFRNAPDKEQLIQLKEYENVFVKALVIGGYAPAKASGPFE